VINCLNSVLYMMPRLSLEVSSGSTDQVGSSHAGVHLLLFIKIAMPFFGTIASGASAVLMQVSRVSFNIVPLNTECHYSCPCRRPDFDKCGQHDDHSQAARCGRTKTNGPFNTSFGRQV